MCTKTLPGADTVLGLAGHGCKNTKHLLSENLNFSEGDSPQENEQEHSSLRVVDVLWRTTVGRWQGVGLGGKGWLGGETGHRCWSECQQGEQDLLSYFKTVIYQTVNSLQIARKAAGKVSWSCSAEVDCRRSHRHPQLGWRAHNQDAEASRGTWPLTQAAARTQPQKCTRTSATEATEKWDPSRQQSAHVDVASMRPTYTGYLSRCVSDGRT